MRWILILFLLPLIFLAGCSGANLNYSPLEKGLYACMVVTTATDMITTDKILDQGGYELNPILGRYPNDEALWMFAGSKILIHSVLGYYSEFWRKWGWGSSCVMSSVLTVYNYGEIK